MKWDIGVFSKIYETFPEESYGFHFKQMKGFSPLLKDDVTAEEDKWILIDEIDAIFFKNSQHMNLLYASKASGVTATASQKGEDQLEDQLFKKLDFQVHSLYSSD